MGPRRSGKTKLKQKKGDKMPDKFYRFEDVHYEDGTRVFKREYSFIKETPCGYWIEDHSWPFELSNQRWWVSKTSRKRFAYPSEEQAIESFVARKRQHIRYTKMRLVRAKEAYKLGLAMMIRMKDEGRR